MHNGSVITLVIALSAIFLLGSCNTSKEDIYTKQMTGIMSYLDAECLKDTTLQTYYTTIDGSNRLTRLQGSDIELTTGDTLDFIFTGYTFNDFKITESNIFTTNDSTVTWPVSDSSRVRNAPYRIVYGQGNLFAGLNLGLRGIHDKEQCEIIFPSALGTGPSHIGTIPANTALAFKVRVDSIRKAVR